MSNRSTRLLAYTFVIFAFTNFVQAKTPAANRTLALSYAAQSIAALTGGVTISDVTLTGAFTWTVASDTETCTATLLALGTGESRIDLALPPLARNSYD